MGADFTFLYHPADQREYEMEEASSDFFVSLFDADIELMKANGLFASFVQQYREQNGSTTQQWAESANEENVKELFANTSHNPDEWDLDDMEWGPSLPFAPAEAKVWAQRWIYFLEEASNEILAAVFPYALDTQTGKSTLQKQWTVEDLQKVIAQAECAQRHNAQMTVEALWS